MRLVKSGNNCFQFVKDWQPRFKLNQVVKGRILRLVLLLFICNVMLMVCLQRQSRRQACGDDLPVWRLEQG